MGAERGKPYRGRHITVTFDGQRCLHAAECVRGLPQVFDTGNRPWISPDAASADEIADVVRRCPSGALQYEMADGATEQPPAPTTVKRTADGTLMIRGDLRITVTGGEGGETVRETRVMLCGCGASGNQPYCDHAGPCGASGDT